MAAEIVLRDGVRGLLVDGRFTPAPLSWSAVDGPDRTWNVSDGTGKVLIGLTTAVKDAVLVGRAAWLAEWEALAALQTAKTVRPIPVPRQLGDADAERVLDDYIAGRLVPR